MIGFILKNVRLLVFTNMTLFLLMPLKVCSQVDDSLKDLNEHPSNYTKISYAQAELLNRLKAASYVNVPYTNLKSSQVCVGTSMGFSSTSNDYLKWKATYTDCIYVEGNVEINSFDPSSSDNDRESELVFGNNTTEGYDFSFLDNIREITGYLLIHNNINLKKLAFKNLRLIRGKSGLLSGRFSLYVENNVMLEALDLVHLKEIQNGAVYVQNNPRLCNTDEVNWLDLMPDKNDNVIAIGKNADPASCRKCTPTCCNSTSLSCGCWFPNGCQNLSKVTCDRRCEGGRCFGPGPYDCCNSQCLGGCDGPSKKDCIACTNLRMKTTGECVDTCPRIYNANSITGELSYNPNGMYQYGITCVKVCPKKTFIYNDFCLKNCEKGTYEEEELVQNPETGEKGMRRFCKPCTPDKCTKTCSIGGELTIANIEHLKDCVVLKSNLIILSDPQVSESYNKTELPRELNETDLEVLSSLKVINGFVRIQSEKFQSLNFLRNLEVIRGNVLLMNKYSMVVIGTHFRTLNLNKLKNVENGIIHLHTEQLCLYETIDWSSIVGDQTSFAISDKNQEYTRSQQCANEGYQCDSACSGCWSTGPRACQLCKTYKVDDACVETCNNTIINQKYTYVQNTKTRECSYCHQECKYGCTGPTEHDCFECANFYIKNGSLTKCVDKCPKNYYPSSLSGSSECLPCYKDCYGCTGPGSSLSPGGCTHCSSGQVENDVDHSVIKCIEQDISHCEDKEFFAIVPETLTDHPLRGKKVCRKCHDECDGCSDNGFKLTSQCKKCKNYFSNSTGNCVRNCSFSSEYLVRDTKTCRACHDECQLGCRGPSQFECTECRTFKLLVSDAERAVQAQAKSITLRGESLLSFSVADEKIDFLNRLERIIEKTPIESKSIHEMIDNLREFYRKHGSDNDLGSVHLCVNSCPPEFPYKNYENFCTSNPLPVNFKMAFVLLLFVITSVFAVFMIILILWNRRINIERMEKENEEKFFSPDFNKGSDPYETESISKVNMSNLRLIRLNELELCRILGRGAFGTVYEGYYKPLDQSNYKVRVAIKLLNKCKLSDEKAVTRMSEELFNEAKVMASVDHEYCLRLTGLCLAEPEMLVTQLMQYGSVVGFYQKYRDLVTEKMLLTWSMQIAEGMSYLESRGIVHRDLAARNILVKKFDQIKITDFGLARILDSNNQEGIYVLEYSLVPFKWLAIESIKSRLFNHKSDVWSYGVCLWEIFTFCSKPYAEYSDSDPLTIFNCICKGTRLAKPHMASLDVYTILLRCWLENPRARPDFKTLAIEFRKMCSDSKRFLSIDKANNQPFKTIDENTHDLLQKFKIDYLDDEPADLSTPRSKSESSDKNSDKSLSKDEYTDPDTASSGFGDTSCSNIEKPKLEERTSRPSLITKSFKRPNASLKIPRNRHHLNSTSDTPVRKEASRNGIRKLFGSFVGNKAKRLGSEKSTGTNSTSTYLSYSCSTVSSPSPRVCKDNKNLNFNFYEEQEELLLNNAANLYHFSSSTTPSSSNSNSTHSSELIPPCTRIYDSNRGNSIYDKRSSSTQNRDYLEPILTNVMQNLEYFGEENEKRVPAAIIIMADGSSVKKANYYNDNMSCILPKKHARTTEI